MPKFIEEIIENHFWREIPVEIPDFSDEECDLNIEDAFIPDNILTL